MRYHHLLPFLLLITAPALPAADLQTLALQPQSVPILRPFDGQVEAINAATVSGQTSGRVAEILFDVGDAVPAGAKILSLVSEDQQGGLQQAQAALADARAGLNVDRLELQRIEALFAKGVVSKAEQERAQGRVTSREAQVKNAEGALRRAQQQMAYTTVQAPFAGVVSERHIELGEAVAPGTPLMSGFDPDHLRVVVDIPQSISAQVRMQPNAQVDPGNGNLIAPAQVQVYPAAHALNGSVKVRLNLPEGSHGLLPGQWVKVAFELGEEAQLLIPRSALLQRSQLSAVYVQTATGIELRNVRVGKQRGDQIEISAGLSAGDVVVLNPLQAVLQRTSSQAQSSQQQPAGAESHE